MRGWWETWFALEDDDGDEVEEEEVDEDEDDDDGGGAEDDEEGDDEGGALPVADSLLFLDSCSSTAPSSCSLRFCVNVSISVISLTM